jgi:hypothetical protein
MSTDTPGRVAVITGAASIDEILVRPTGQAL